MFFFFFKQKTAYEKRISDWSSDVCSSDLKWKTAADDPAGWAQAQSYDQLVAQTRQYTSNAQAAQQRLQLSEDTIASGVGLLQHVRELVVQANTATQSADTRKTDRKSTRLNSSH